MWVKAGERFEFNLARFVALAPIHRQISRRKDNDYYHRSRYYIAASDFDILRHIGYLCIRMYCKDLIVGFWQRLIAR